MVADGAEAVISETAGTGGGGLGVLSTVVVAVVVEEEEEEEIVVSGTEDLAVSVDLEEEEATLAGAFILGGAARTYKTLLHRIRTSPNRPA